MSLCAKYAKERTMQIRKQGVMVLSCQFGLIYCWLFFSSSFPAAVSSGECKGQSFLVKLESFGPKGRPLSTLALVKIAVALSGQDVNK